MRKFSPQDWYWIADDGRIFASARIAIVPADDATFLAWTAAGDAPTRWPSDASGLQTDAALQDVLTPYGLHAGLATYAAARRYAAEVAGVMVGGVVIATDRDSQAMIANAFAYLQASGAATVEFKSVSGWATLAAEQIKAAALAVGAHVQACFAIESRVDAGLTATPPTITSRADVDAAFAALV